jgi:hypothetical protein
VCAGREGGGGGGKRREGGREGRAGQVMDPIYSRRVEIQKHITYS